MSTKTESENETEEQAEERTHRDKLEDVFQAIKPRSRENAIYAADVAKVAGIEDGDYNRTTRKLIEELVEDYDVPIASGNNGFFFLDDPNDLAEYLTRLDATIEGTRQRKESVTAAYNRYKSAERSNEEVGFEFTFDEDEDVDDGFVLVDETIDQLIESGFETVAEAKGWANRFGFVGDAYVVRSADDPFGDGGDVEDEEVDSE